MKGHWRKILWPFSLLYGWGTALRNFAFDRAWLKSEKYPVPVIAIGNLSTGGSGKTPMVEYLLKKLSGNKTAVLSRGYGRQSKGMHQVEVQDNAAISGDEPLQIKRKFPQSDVILNADRNAGIKYLLQNSPAEVILLDDAFQHRYVDAGFKILLSTYQQPFYRDLILPAGNLRESRRGSKRADIIVITKCPPDLKSSEAKAISGKTKLQAHQKIYFSGITYGRAVNAAGRELAAGEKVIALAGIARPDLFFREVEAHFRVCQKAVFPDHHNFSAAEIRQVQKDLETRQARLLCTEKDFMRLQSQIATEHLFYLPMEVYILFDQEAELLQNLREFIQRYQIN